MLNISQERVAGNNLISVLALSVLAFDVLVMRRSCLLMFRTLRPSIHSFMLPQSQEYLYKKKLGKKQSGRPSVFASVGVG